MLTRCPNCGFWIELGTKKQRSYYFAVVVYTMAVELGWTPKEVHEYWKAKFIPRNEKRIGGEIIMLPGSTEDLTKEQKTQYVDFCIMDAAEHGVVIPEPRDQKHKIKGL